MEERRLKERDLIRMSFRDGKDVCLQTFYFIDFQSLYEVPDKEDIRYLPCEVAMSEYSLYSGHSKHLHKFIDPGELLPSNSSFLQLPLFLYFMCSSLLLSRAGPIPMGYRYLAMNNSDKTHQIPVEKFELAERDYRSILGDLERFVTPDDRGRVPPVFAKVSGSRWLIANGYF